MAYTKLNIQLNGQALHHNDLPKYLEIKLDRTISFKTHLQNTAAKHNLGSFSADSPNSCPGHCLLGILRASLAVQQPHK
ncbi:hypothetical protein J437_LFUL015089 [Ladona fulva]|uniref:Uncharacterized protein n=1 Tax=Ladona fulva TaxID=123851 RepID=A0A8K0PBZ7_LADFU|nr:hypothetical protein J437_LFUL015089 [Ladona fulva]